MTSAAIAALNAATHVSIAASPGNTSTADENPPSERPRRHRCFSVLLISPKDRALPPNKDLDTNCGSRVSLQREWGVSVFHFEHVFDKG